MQPTIELVRLVSPRAALALLCGLGLVVWLGFPVSGEAAEEPVKTCSATPTGDFILYGDLVDCSIKPKGDTDVFRFSGSKDEIVRVHIAGLTGTGDPCIELFDPDGNFMASECFGNPIDARLRKDGTHTIVVSEYGDEIETLQYRLGLQCIAGGPGGCPVTPVPEVSGCVSLILDPQVFSG